MKQFFFILMIASLAIGCKKNSDPAPETQKCIAPTGLTASAITASGATISWTAVSGATGYAVDYKINSSSTWISAIASTTATTLNLTGLSASSLYDYRVNTNCGTNSTSDYGTAQFTTEAVSSSNTNDPRVGSQWSYKQTTYNESGAVTSTSTLNLKGVSVIVGGTEWLSLDITPGNTPLLYIQKRTDGWWYLPKTNPANTISSLWFKYPAAVNDQYPYVYGTCKVLSASASITVPAGAFANTYFVEGDDLNSKEDEFWFTDNGPVLVRFDTYDAKAGRPEDDVYRKQSLELISYIR